MGTRLELHTELLTFCDNVYFQPPANVVLNFPCIVYKKSPKELIYANNFVYKTVQGYQLTVIDKNPDSLIPDEIVMHFPYIDEDSNFVSDNLNHTVSTVYY